VGDVQVTPADLRIARQLEIQPGDEYGRYRDDRGRFRGTETYRASGDNTVAVTPLSIHTLSALRPR
jgi:hypothetical protein